MAKGSEHSALEAKLLVAIRKLDLFIGELSLKEALGEEVEKSNRLRISFQEITQSQEASVAVVVSAYVSYEKPALLNISAIDLDPVYLQYR